MNRDLDAGDIRRSWTGTGSLEINGPDDHFELRDYVLVLVYVIVVDVIGYLAGAPFQHQHTVCGPTGPSQQCFGDPHTSIHNAVLYIWLTGVVAVVTIAATAAWKVGRVAVAVLQGVIFAAVVIVAVAAVIRAQGQQQELQLCHFGTAGPCVGVHQGS